MAVAVHHEVQVEGLLEPGAGLHRHLAAQLIVCIHRFHASQSLGSVPRFKKIPLLAVLVHLLDASDVGAEYGDGPGQRLGYHHWRHLVQRCQDQRIGDLIEGVDVVRNIQKFNTRIACNLSLDLFEVLNLVNSGVARSHNLQARIRLVFRKLFEELYSPELILAWTNDT